MGKQAWNGMEDLNFAWGPWTYRGLSHPLVLPPGLEARREPHARPGDLSSKVIQEFHPSAPGPDAIRRAHTGSEGRTA